VSRPLAAAVVLAALADAAVAEPPARLHPVAWLGRAIDALDRPWRRPRLVAPAVAALVPLAAAGAVAGVVVLAARAGTAAATLTAAAALFVTASRSMLLSAARDVVDAAGDDPATARERAPALVGRDPDALSPAELRSAAVESAAENLADGLVAPLAAFVLAGVAGVVRTASGEPGATLAGGVALGVPPATLPLALAAAGAAWTKAVNTLDSMLGYREKPLGWAAARLDDLAMWAPARLSAALLAVAAADPAAAVRARAHADRPRSPNSGWPMAALAAALPTRLRKPGRYEVGPADDLPDRETARRGVAVVGRAGWLAVAVAVAAALAPEVVAWS